MINNLKSWSNSLKSWSNVIDMERQERTNSVKPLNLRENVIFVSTMWRSCQDLQDLVCFLSRCTKFRFTGLRYKTDN